MIGDPLFADILLVITFASYSIWAPHESNLSPTLGVSNELLLELISYIYSFENVPSANTEDHGNNLSW